jgi:hypothetical protein
MFFIRSMNQTPSRPDQTTNAPQEFRGALAELVQIGMRVARMVGLVADAETELAESAAQASAAEGASALATSLAEAIEADRAAAAAAEARQTVVARVEAVAAAFRRVARAIRLTVAHVERLDRGWARRSAADDRQAMARRQIARSVEDAIANEAKGERAEKLRETLTERLESPDWEDLLEDRSPEEVIAIICRELGLDPVRMTVRSPLPKSISVPEMEGAVPLTTGRGWQMRPPDG